MAHNVSFHVGKGKDEKDLGHFFGYRGGIFYQAFNANDLNKGVSGSNKGVWRTPKEVATAIQTLKTLESDTQVKEVIDFLQAQIDKEPNESIYIHFS